MQSPEAWTGRQILVGYYSADNETLKDILWTGMIPGMRPVHALDLRFPEQQLRRVRADYAGMPDAGIWRVSEFQMFSGNTPIAPDERWHFNAYPNP